MSDTAKWVIVIVVLVLIVGLVAFARGGEHRRGDDVGSSAWGGATVVALGGELG
jgi:hypothetical protein